MSFAFMETPKSSVRVSINHSVNKKRLVLDSLVSKNEFDQDYTISKLKYYVGKFCLTNNNADVFKSELYFLVDEENPESKTLILNQVPEGEYNGMEFILGVDSADNCRGAQSGALDPVNGMFWTWNTGYIYLKIEGHSGFCNTPSHFFEYHIGGFKVPYNSMRHFKFKFKKDLVIKAGMPNSIELNFDAAQILKTPNAIDFTKLPSVTDLKNSNLISDNYSDVFTVTDPVQ